RGAVRQPDLCGDGGGAEPRHRPHLGLPRSAHPVLMATIAPLSAPSLAVEAATLPRTRPWYTDVWIRMLRKPLGVLGAVIVVTMLLGAIFADVLTPYGFSQTSL